MKLKHYEAIVRNELGDLVKVPCWYATKAAAREGLEADFGPPRKLISIKEIK